MNTMNIEIWSDFTCPFCYIGKRKFEKALQQFPHTDKLSIRWRSYELAPNTQIAKGQKEAQHLVERKGWTLEYAERMMAYVTALAREQGVQFQYANALAANTFDAHRLAQLAAHKGLANEAEEAILAAHFTDGADIADHATLLELAIRIGLNATEAQQLLSSNAYANEVRADEQRAAQLGIQGVPFFLINEKHSLSGAQDISVFLHTLEKAFAETE